MGLHNFQLLLAMHLHINERKSQQGGKFQNCIKSFSRKKVKFHNLFNARGVHMLSPQIFCEDLTGCQGITLNTTQNIWHSYLRISAITCEDTDFSDRILVIVDVCMLYCWTSTLKNQIELDYLISHFLFPIRILKTPGVK